MEEKCFCHFNGYQVKDAIARKAHPTPEMFGAVGDGVKDDSEAFVKMVSSEEIGEAIFLSPGSNYRITKQIDLKGKSLIGCGRTYNDCKIVVSEGDYSNEDPTLNNIAFINCGMDIMNLFVDGSAVGDAVSGFDVKTFRGKIQNVHAEGFYNQFVIRDSAVYVSFVDLYSVYMVNCGVYVTNVTQPASTTTYFQRCLFGWGKQAVKSEGEFYNASFRDIILEEVEEGIEAICFTRCAFSNIWPEGTRGTGTKAWIKEGVSGASKANTFYAIRGDDEYKDPSLYFAGIWQTLNGHEARDTSGANVIYDAKGIRTRNHPWLTNRSLVIETEPPAEGSGYVTPIEIKAPNGELYFRNTLDNDFTPTIFKRVIGADPDNAEAPYYGRDIYTPTKKQWTTINPATKQEGKFSAPLMLSYSNYRQNPQNNGWKITKTEETGVFSLANDNPEASITEPNIVVSGIMSGSGSGTCQALIPSIQVTSGSSMWVSWAWAKSWRIYFRNLQGELEDPAAFTVMLSE